VAAPPFSPGDITHVPECCACGVEGLGLRRWTDGERVRGEIVLDHRHGGYSNTAHGGMIAIFLDDLLGSVPQLHGHLAVTGTLEIRYRRPGILGHRYTLSAWLLSHQGRRMEITGEMVGEEGLIAEATGTWVTVDSTHHANAVAAARDAAERRD
jgi:acyl-coenzyme A thioesterase PaaI-like protein